MSPMTKSDEGDRPPSPAPIEVSEQQRKAMLTVDSSSNPTVTPIGKITYSWTDAVLEKDKGIWTDWAYQMKLALSMTGLWEYVFEPPAPPHSVYEPRAYRAFNNNNRIACSFILQALSKSEQKLCPADNNPVQLWAYLKRRHEGAVPVKQVSLLQDALTAMCSNEEPLTKTLDDVYDKIDRAFSAGSVTPDLLKSIASLAALRAFPHIRSIVSRDIAAATADKPYGPEEIRRYVESEQALLDADNKAATSQDPQPTAFATTKPAQRTSNNKTITCDACKARGRSVNQYTGHTQPWCVLEGGGMEGKTVAEARKARLAHFDARRKGGDKPKSNKLTVTTAGGAAFTIEGDAEAIAAYIASHTDKTPTKQEFAGLVTDPLPLHATGSLQDAENLEIDAWIALEEEPRVSIDWEQDKRDPEHHAYTTISTDLCPFYLDSGATIHVSPDPSDFSKFKTITPRPIRGVGGSSIAAIGAGSIRLPLANGATIEVENALYVPQSTVRLLSISKLAKNVGIATTFDDVGATLVIKATKQIIANGTLLPSKDLYALNLTNDRALAVHAPPDLKSWHLRLGHANYQSILEMARAGLIEGMPSTFPSKPPKCDHCILGKQTRTPVPKEREEGVGHRATRRLEKIWIDLTGKSAVSSRTGNNYIMNIVDDYTNKPWSIPLKLKSDAFAELKAWIAARELETGERLRILRTGRDGELNSNEYKLWYKAHGITLEVGAPHTSAHMGRVERMHRTLMGKARSMRLAAECPTYLWDEFYMTATHLHGKTKTSAVRNVTPDELWYGRRPDYSYIREIGCRAFVLILHKHNPKVLERSIECILIGYDQNSKAYRCWDRAAKKVYSSYHVKFIESHNDHMSDTPLPYNDDTETPSIQEVERRAESQPRDTDEDEGPQIPGVVPTIPQPNEIEAPHDDHAQMQQPRRSTRIVILTAKATDQPMETRTEKAVRESKESAERIREQRTDRRKALEELRRDVPENDDTINDVNDVEIDHVLAMLNTIEGDPEINPDADPDTPKSWRQAQESVDAEKWRAGYQEELNSLKNMGVFELVPPDAIPTGQRIHKGKPVFTLKRDEHGNITRYKVRYVVQGFNQIYGRDYTKTTSPTARAESWRILLHMAAALGWDATQVDVKTAFLNGYLPEEETIYMAQPDGFREPGKEDWVWRLRRALYGMKQAGRIWNKTLNDQMIRWGFKRLESEACIYYRKTEKGIVIVGIHVDDFLSIASTKTANDHFKEELRSVWSISDLGIPKHIVGIAVEWDRTNRHVYLSQTALIDRLVAQFGQTDAAPISVPMDPGLKLRKADYSTLSQDEREKISRIPYRQLVGGLLWLAISSRPDIQYAVQQLTQYFDSFSFNHWNAGIRVLRYLKGTRDLRLRLGGTLPITLTGFTDSDWANCLDTRRSVGGYAWSLGSGIISWASRKQRTVAVSSCEAEYMAAFEAAQECIWLRMVLLAIGFEQTNATTLLCDNNSSINLSEDPLLHSRVKHVDIKYHFLRERVEAGDLRLRYINTKENVADIFTKALSPQQFTRLRHIMGLVSSDDSTRGGVRVR